MISFTKSIILLKPLLIKRKSNALMKIYAPSLECKYNLFPSEPRKHCQRAPSQNILCSLKLPSGPPQIHFPANPAGLLYVFLSYISLWGILRWALLKVFLMSYYDTAVGHLWPSAIKERREGERCEKRDRKWEAERRETQRTERGAKAKPDRGDKW